MKNILLLLSLVFVWGLASYGQSSSATYTEGEIETDNPFSASGAQSVSSCPGLLTVTIPVGAIITSVDVSYSMTASSVGVADGWMSEQRSRIVAINPGGLAESGPANGYYSGSGNSQGTHNYNRTGLTIANDIIGGGEIHFEMHAFRTWAGGGGSGNCSPLDNKVDNNTWTVTVYYFEPADYDFTLTVPDGTVVTTGESYDYTVTINNTGLENDTYDIEVDSEKGWTYAIYDADGVAVISELAVDAGESEDFIVRVTVPAGAGMGDTDTQSFTVTSQGDDTISEDFEITTTAVATVTVFPFEEGFEAENAPPVGWTKWYANANPPIGNLMIHSSDQALSGDRSFRFSSFSSGPPYDQYLMTPPLDLPGEMELSFWYRRHTWGTEVFAVGTSTDGENWTWGGNIADATISWQEFSMIIPAATQYVAIHYKSNFEYYLFVDDFVIKPPPACPVPTALTAININATSAHLGWAIGGDEDEWNIEWGEEGFEPGEGSMIEETDQNPYPLTGLEPVTAYEFYVQAVCGEENLSEWVGPFAFMTDCEAVEEFAENFDGVTAPALPICWSKTVYHPTSTFAHVQTITGTEPNSLPNHVSMYNSTTYNANAEILLISPEISSNLKLMRLRFFAKNGSNPENLLLGTILDPTDAATFTELESYELTSTYSEYVYSFANYTGADKYIAFKHGNSVSWRYIYLDDIVLEPLPTEPVFAINPESKDFGEVGVGDQSLAQVFTIRNDGPGKLGVDAPELDNVVDFILVYDDTDFPAELEDDDTVTFSVIFAPDAEGEKTGEVTISFGDVTKDSFTVELEGNGIFRPAGSTCGNPYIATLPFEHIGNTEIYGNDYLSSWINPSSLYLNGYDFVVQFTLTEPSFLTGSVAGSWTGLIILEDCPNPDSPAERLGFAGSSTGGTISDLVLPAGTYFAIVSTYPTPNFTDFTLNLSAEPLPACPDPIDLAVTEITDISALLSWSWLFDNPGQWNVEVGLPDFGPGIGDFVTGEMGVLTNTWLATGLSFNTTYHFYVQSVCDDAKDDTDNISEWAGPFIFTTECGVFASFPWIETFENDSDTRACWTQIREQGFANWTFASGSSDGEITSAHEGNLNARFVSTSGTNTPITKLITPLLNISNLDNPFVDFWYGQEVWAGDQNELKVYYRTGVEEPWVEIEHFTENTPVWTNASLALPEKSATYQIAFEGINNWGRANVLDFVRVYDSLCEEEVDLTLTDDIDIQINGPESCSEYPHVNVDGVLNINEEVKLNVHMGENYNPAAGEKFVIFTYGTLDGKFSNQKLFKSVCGRVTFIIDYGDNDAKNNDNQIVLTVVKRAFEMIFQGPDDPETKQE